MNSMTNSIYENIENAILERLKPLEALPRIIVELMPENQAGYQRATVDAKLWVVFAGSDSGSTRASTLPITDMGNSIQEETYNYQVMITARKLRGDNGVYHLVKLVKERLLGYEPCGLDKMALVNVGFDKGEEAYKENLWTYVLTFVTKGIMIETLPVEDLPGLQEVAFEEAFV
jgi:hypothetical protein